MWNTAIFVSSFSLLVIAAPSPRAANGCIQIAGKTFSPPADALSCMKSFAFNETLRQNILTNVARVFDFFSFESYYLDSPPPFEESTNNIRDSLARINSTVYGTDYDFNKDLYDFVTQLNDGHTRWFPTCYTSFQNIIPVPVISLEEDGVESVFIAPDSVEYISQLGDEFTGYYDSINFNWKRLAGAKILEIGGQDPYDYVDHIASTVSGNFLDHGVRVNSVFTSYLLLGSDFSQRLGDLAGPNNVEHTSLTFKLVPLGSTISETVVVPYLASYLGAAFTDADSFWQSNCAVKDGTNGQDFRKLRTTPPPKPKIAKAEIIDKGKMNALALPSPFHPVVPTVDGSTGVIQSFILPDGQTGVMYVGSFSEDPNSFEVDVISAITAFKSAGITRLLIDLTNNNGARRAFDYVQQVNKHIGGYVCLGQFLHQYLAGSNSGYPGFVSSIRAGSLAQKIVAADIVQELDVTRTFFTADNWLDVNGTRMQKSFDYINPPTALTINDRSDPTSKRFLNYQDTCSMFFSNPVPADPPFDLSKIAIVSNGNCASTCAMFSTLMYEKHNTTIAVFGGKPGESMEFKGMSGNQVLEWTDLDSEIKTAGLKEDPLAPPDLLVNGNFRADLQSLCAKFYLIVTTGGQHGVILTKILL
ncbi:hypothetical protein BDQ12DRAFT_671469 [Crucibulum laeve]|uniref:Tail specific protease domain-containing protein n=1 Tax=Crucibulum laeve TaxID=68775 RepID=A0A5C3LGE5_9AGAR|nr:hypothetical protein BDQ12DRAFT_671469 [Crucibulum laeve]